MKLTVGMATYDDFDGVYFTVQALRLYHPEGIDDLEIIVVDNNPDSAHGKAVRDFVTSWVRNSQYIPFRDAVGTSSSRDKVFQVAKGEYVLCVDCDVLLAPDALRKFVDYLDANDCSDLLQGPMLLDDPTKCVTHMEPTWRGEMHGIWANYIAVTDLPSDPIEIPQHGLGIFGCRKDSWLGFNPHFRGFGGEEGYIHQKYRQANRTTWCLPFLQWGHRFQRPAGVKYPLTKYNKIRNYIIGRLELDCPYDDVIEHFSETASEAEIDKAVFDAREALNLH